MRWVGLVVGGVVALGCSGRTAPAASGSGGEASSSNDPDAGDDASTNTPTDPSGPSDPGDDASTNASTDPSGPPDTGDSTAGPPEDPCTLAPDGGSCNAAFERWYFDPVTSRCAGFSWGGCEGVVPFETLAECSVACESCEVQSAPAMPTMVTVTITNETATPIYIEAVQPDPVDPIYFVRQEYVLTDEASEEPLATHAGACDAAFSCTAVGSSEACGCDPGPPYQPGAIRIDPGAAYEATSWNSLVWSDGTIASACVDAGCGASEGDTATCRRALPYVGKYLIASARASRTLDGEDCDASATGWCETAAGSVPTGTPLEVYWGFAFPIGHIPLTFTQ